jgi:two-component system, OmpR family, response regulator
MNASGPAEPAPFGPDRILVVDDDVGILDVLSIGLRRAGYAVTTARDGAAALRALDDEPALVVLDIGLPDLDGFAVLDRIRARSDVPVILLTARGDPEDRVRGLDLGADDYVSKPFDLPELVARVRARLRRPARRDTRSLSLGPVAIDLASRTVHIHGRPIDLTPTEFDLLALLASRQGETLSKAQILDHLWGYSFDPNLVEVYIGYLRRKMGDPTLIRTVRGVGYTMEDVAMGHGP